MLGTKKRHSDLNAENGKRSKQAHEEESNGAEESSCDNDQQQQVSIDDDQPTSDSISDSIDELGRLAEVIIEFDVKFNDAKSKENEQLLDVIKVDIALRNTSGGIIKINSPQKVTVKDRDKLMNGLHEKRKTLFGSECGEIDSLNDILDFKTNESTTYIFVRKSSVPILTDDSNLCQRSEGRIYRVHLYSRICQVLNRKKSGCICAEEEKFKTSFRLDDTLSYETMTEEHKLLKPKNNEKLAKCICDKLSENIVAFANTRGGTIYFGIEDEKASIKGQKIEDDEEKADIHRRIVECMERKLWALDSGEGYKPKEGSDYHIKFFPVEGTDDKVVIAVHICAFPGTAVFRKTPECSVLDEENQIVNMGFQEWLSLHKTVSVGNSNFQEHRSEKTELETSAYYSVKETVQKFVTEFTSASPGELRLHPSHAVEWIKCPALEKFVDLTRKAFQENKWHSGIAYIERCWEVNLGLPSTKPGDVICDILLCCPQMPLVFVSLTQSDITEASCSYNRKVAARLKAALVQEANCLEKFYVKHVVVSRQQLLEVDNLSWIYSESPLYPETYKMNGDKYYKVLEALVLVLARANVMASHIVGQGLFNLLTCEQYDILHEFYKESPKVKITGPPGSGKTVLALERIHRLRNDGCSYDEVLFLCSNKPLKARVKNMKTRDGQPLCIVKTYDEVGSLVQSDEGFDNELGNVKHILADEAQNFQESDSYLGWWNKLHNLCDEKEDSSFWVFFDFAQKINNKRSVSLRRFTKKELTTIIRQTGNVHRFITSKYMRVDPQVKLGHDFDGPNVDVLVPFATDPNQMHLVYILFSQLHNLIVKDGHHMNDITVLFNDDEQKERYQRLFVQRTNSSCPVRNGEEVEKHGVVFDTIRRYCGVDDNIIIGFCPQYYPSNFQNNCALMTTLCSRAKLKLILILENAEIAECFDLAPAELKKVKVGNIKKVSNFPGNR